jgi:hypothetical protein
MRLETFRGLMARAIAGGLVAISVMGAAAIGGDEPSRLGRLFRLGGSSSSSTPTTPAVTPPPSSMTRSMQEYNGPPALSTSPTTPPGSTGPRLTPRPRVNKPVTEADPLVTRVSLGRSDNGSQFGMFLQVFADGTVIDGEGVHHVPAEGLKPVVDAVASGDLGRFKGHCGGPAGDFIESVQVVTYERSYGRLRANSFSYSGNTQGCDHAVHHLQKVLDDLQTKLSPSAPAVPPAPAASAGNPSHSLQGLMTSPPLPLSSTP